VPNISTVESPSLETDVSFLHSGRHSS